MSTYTTLSNTELEQHFATEMRRLVQADTEPAAIVLQPHHAYTLIGLLQMVCRHPEINGFPREVAMQVANGLAGMFDPASAIAESIRRGWDERYD